MSMDSLLMICASKMRVAAIFKHNHGKGIIGACGGNLVTASRCRVTEAQNHAATHFSVPQGLDFFLDPCFVITRNKACRLNKTHTGLTVKGYSLEMTR